MSVGVLLFTLPTAREKGRYLGSGRIFKVFQRFISDLLPYCISGPDMIDGALEEFDFKNGSFLHRFLLYEFMF